MTVRFFAISKVGLDDPKANQIIAIDSEHNLNTLYIMRRMNPHLQFMAVSNNVAREMMEETEGTGIGCYSVSENIYANRFRRKQSIVKLQAFMTIAKGFYWMRVVPVVHETIIDHEPKEILRPVFAA